MQILGGHNFITASNNIKYNCKKLRKWTKKLIDVGLVLSVLCFYAILRRILLGQLKEHGTAVLLFLTNAWKIFFLNLKRCFERSQQNTALRQSGGLQTVYDRLQVPSRRCAIVPYGVSNVSGHSYLRCSTRGDLAVRKPKRQPSIPTDHAVLQTSTLRQFHRRLKTTQVPFSLRA